MATHVQGKKHPKLVKTEDDFEKLRQFLSHYPKTRKTKRITQLIFYLGLFNSSAHIGWIRCCDEIYKLKDSNYFHKDVKKVIKKKLWEVLPLYKTYARPGHLFG